MTHQNITKLFVKNSCKTTMKRIMTHIKIGEEGLLDDHNFIMLCQDLKEESWHEVLEPRQEVLDGQTVRGD